MLEILAEEIHNIWMGWAKSLMSSENLSKERIDRWVKCFIPYKELSENEKDKDRKIAILLLDKINGEKK